MGPVPDPSPAPRPAAEGVTDAAEIERRIVTVLFADIVGFTTLSERLDPEDVATVQEAYFAAVREIIGRYGGLIEKFIGDAVMAVFGLPVARDDDAERAVRAGLALTASVEHLAGRLGLQDASLQVRVGVNTGEVVSTQSAGEWRVTGDTVNTAARLQTGARPGGVLIGETTSLTVADAVELESAGGLELKGKAEPVRAWHALRVHLERSRDRAMGELRAPMLGRDREADLLRSAIGRLEPGHTERLLIVAPPGSGKSRLLAEIAASPPRPVRLVVAPVRDEPEPSFPAVTRLMRSALAAANAEPGGQRLVELLVERGVSALRAGVLAGEVGALVGAVVGPVVGVGRPGEAAAGVLSDRAERFAAWIEVLDRLAGELPSVWIFEDLHWAGPDLLAFIEQAHETPSEHGRLVIGSARPSLLEREPAWCGPRVGDRVTRLDLEQLTPVSAAMMIAALVGDALPADLAERIAVRSDGNPLFIEELIRAWLSVGILVHEGAGFRLVDPDRVVDLPMTVQAIYAGQLDDLPPDARSVARRASVAGRVFALEALPALDAPGGGVDSLLTRAFVTGPVDAELGASYAYRHVLLRDAGYATLARAERARLHVRLADWMVAVAAGAGDPLAATIAGHYEAALAQMPALSASADLPERDELRLRAGSWLERAARVALAESAHAAAAGLARRALDLTPEVERLDRARRLALLADATAFSGDMDRAVADYRSAADLFAAELATSAQARDGYAQAIAALGELLIEQLSFREAEALADEALARVGEADDLASARLLFLRAWARIAYSSNADVDADLARVIAIAEREGEGRLQLEATFHRESLRGERGELSRREMIDGAESLAALAEAAGNPRRASAALRSSALLAVEAEPGAVPGLLDRADLLALAHGLREEEAWIAYARAETGLATGDWLRAWEAGERALQLGEANSYHRPVVRTWLALTPIALAQGRIDALRRAKEWIEPRRSSFPDSPFGRFMQTAMDLRLVAAGLLPPFEPPASLLDIWDEAPGMASFYAAMETNLGAWIELGRLDLVEAALSRMARWDGNDGWMTPYRTGSESLVRARYQLARERIGARPVAGSAGIGTAIAAARRSLEAFESVHALWGLSKAIRLLEEAGGATSAEVGRAAEIELALGMAGATSGRG